MLSRESAERMHFVSTNLVSSPKFQKSRTLRRFLSEVLSLGGLCQSFAFEEGYSLNQLQALQKFAADKAQAQQAAAQQYGFELVGTVMDEAYNLVLNSYKVPFKLEEASLKQLQAAVHFVRELSLQMLAFARDPAQVAGFEDYRYRGLPCSIVPDEALWSVSGCDQRQKGAGVLEWCFDEADAKAVLAEMNRFPDRFTSLSAKPYQRAAGVSSVSAEVPGQTEHAA